MKKAFTMIELVFVIVVIGILAAVMIPRTDSNNVKEAAIDLVSKIRYTQHLAMVDDKFGDNTPGTVDWYKKRWQIRFDTDNNKYSIINNNTNAITSSAVDTSNNGKNIFDVDLNAKYNVTVDIDGAECEIDHDANDDIYSIAFDNLGRPITGDLNTLTSSYAGTDVRLVKTDDCAIVLTDGSDTATINIRPETGYASITY